MAGRIEENSAEVDTKLRHIERDVLRKSSKEIKASLDHVDSQMRAKRDDINRQMEQVAISITDDKVLGITEALFFGAPYLVQKVNVLVLPLSNIFPRT